MPLYDYSCDRCGSFSDWNSMDRALDPVACPACSLEAQRIIHAPYLNTMNAHNRVAHQRNERSAEAPAVMSRAQLDSIAGPCASHGHHHGHSHRHGAVNPALERLTGSKEYKQSDKPSMIGH